MNAPNQKPVRILYCIDSLLRGGTELQLIGLIERLDPDRFKPYLLTIRPTDPALIPPNCEHLAWQVPKLFSWSGIKAVLRLKQWIRCEEIDVVQTYFQDSTIVGGVSAALAGVSVRIACFRDLGFWQDRKQSFLMKAVFPVMTSYLCNAQIIKSHFNERFGTSVDKTTVLKNGIDSDALSFIDHGGRVTDIGIVGNMTRRVKRTDLFIKAAAIVAKEFPEIAWHIVGDGHLRPELENLADSLGVREKVRFTGRINDVSSYIEHLQIGVICSDSEGLSNALLEYMAKGTVSVATSVGGNPELIRDGETGLLVPADDHEALAEAIRRLVVNEELYRTLAHNARLSIDQEYSWSTCVADHQNYYLKALMESQGAGNEIR